jgi:hypothetical protein
MYIGHKKALALYITLALGTGVVHAAQTAVLCTPITNTGNNNFTMLAGDGSSVGGTNDVTFTWDGTMFNANSDYTGPGSVSNAAIASVTAFFGATTFWTAHDVQVFAPGTYTFNTALGGGNPESGIMTMNVGANQLGMHMLFDWNGNLNIDVVVVADKNATFGSGNDTFHEKASCFTSSGKAIAGANCLWAGPGFLGGNNVNRPSDHHVWMLASVDQAGGDGTPGTPMAPLGPFAGFNANFNFNGTLSPSDGVCGPATDTTPDPFSFSGVINATFNTLYTTSAITVSGLGVSPPGVGITAPITISGGGSPQYSLNGGITWTNAPGTVINGDTVMVRATSGLANGSTVTATLNIGGVTGSFTVSTPAAVGNQGSNFTMLDSAGGIVGGTNDVAASWDSSCTTNVASNDFSHMSLSSNTPFFSYNWTAHHIRVFCPGTYIINTACTTGNSSAQDIDAGTCTPNTDPTKNYTFTVAAGQIGGHMLFDWNTTKNIDVVEVWSTNAIFGPSKMYTSGAACNNPATVWNLMSTDWDGDSKNGGAMIDGPFTYFSANFNIRTSGTPLACSTIYTPTVNVADPSNTAGCSISSTPENVTERADWWLIAGFLTWLGAIRLRFKRRQTKF